MVRAAGQGHGRNDAATTDPQPRARLPGAGLRALGRGSAWSGLQAWARAHKGLGPGAWGPGPRAAPKNCSSL